MIDTWDMTAHFVHFSGEWDEEHLRMVEEAAARFERRSNRVLLPPGWKPWVCICRRVAGAFHFSASRVGMDGILISETAEELARKIASAE